MIDIRPAESFAKLALPGSMNIQIRDLFGKDLIVSLSQRHIKKVLIGENETQEHSACLLLQELGYENLAILQGGIDVFNKTILSPSAFIPTGTRWDADVIRFRDQARLDILQMMEEHKNKAPKTTKKEKKIQGGC
jgi:rhodanese-related sulfurtransferase